MKGVDWSDQKMSYYAMERKSLRWYKKIFIHMLQLIIINIYKMNEFYNPCKGKKHPLLPSFNVNTNNQQLSMYFPNHEYEVMLTFKTMSTKQCWGSIQTEEVQAMCKRKEKIINCICLCSVSR
uniref:PiggyBac transposable element-derived protein domain-containing protein n=1 Tax=Homalodisca liturata TaxID=320908 RepID=A0A1B6JMZ4_9HEMI